MAKEEYLLERIKSKIEFYKELMESDLIKQKQYTGISESLSNWFEGRAAAEEQMIRSLEDMVSSYEKMIGYLK